jgi:predicted HTH transcriptional regulator
MTMDNKFSAAIIETMEQYLAKNRPPVEIRAELDVGYEISGQSVVIFEIRPVWNDPSKIQHQPYAKATFVAKDNSWKVYWMRANLKWYPYEPKPKVKKLSDFLKLVEEDKYACFKG